jgi:hypothetical protein
MSMKRSVFIFCLYFVSVLSCGPNQVSVDNTCWCTSGYYCPTNIGTAIACPNGYTSNLGAQSDLECYVAGGVILNVSIDYASMNTTDTAFPRRKLLNHHAQLVTHSKDKLADSLRVQSSLKQAIHIRDLKQRFSEKLLSPPNKKQTTQGWVHVAGQMRKP